MRRNFIARKARLHHVIFFPTILARMEGQKFGVIPPKYPMFSRLSMWKFKGILWEGAKFYALRPQKIHLLTEKRLSFRSKTLYLALPSIIFHKSTPKRLTG